MILLTRTYSRCHAGQTLALAIVLIIVASRCWADGLAIEAAHPRLFIADQPAPGLRSMAQLKTQLQESRYLADCWQTILRNAQRDRTTPPITPTNFSSPQRSEQNRRIGNPDYIVCRAAGQRILRNALASLILDDARQQQAYREIALQQIATLFDRNAWPDWRDQAHRRFPVDLRNGSLGRDIAIAYDWMYDQLTESQRDSIIHGLDRRAIQPFWDAVDKDVDWVDGSNNWTTCVVGGLGIVGMALAGDHPDGIRLVEFSLPRMTNYLSHYGRNGEFNESVGYSSATRLPVVYFDALRYARRSRDDAMNQWPLVDTAYWNVYTLIPPGRFVGFGDAHVKRRVSLDYLGPIASASRDEVLQWFYLNGQQPEEADRELPLSLLGFDASLDVQDPAGSLPLGRAFSDHGCIIVSRTSWDCDSAKCVVYGKAGIEQNHEHHDAGQVCIDGYGERLIVDLGSPSGYPADFFGPNRWRYYNASWIGHNVITTEDDAMIAPRGAKANIVMQQFDDQRGGCWQLDLTRFYPDASQVRRTVVHLTPGIVVVLDDARFERSKEITLRWHTSTPSHPTADGAFTVSGERACLTARIVDLSSPTADARWRVGSSQHRYAPPFDRSRTGEDLQQRHEDFVWVQRSAPSARILSLFAVDAAAQSHSAWEPSSVGYQVSTADGKFQVAADEHQVRVSDAQGREWAIDLGP